MEAKERKAQKRWYLTDEEMDQLKKAEERFGYLEICKRCKMYPATFYRILKIRSARKKTIETVRKVLSKMN